MKKMISLLVVLALLTAGMVIAAFATDNTVIAVEKIEAAAGEEVTLEVVITNNPGFAAAKFTVEYDETALTLVGVDTTGCLLEGATENDAKGVVAFAATSNKTEDGVLFTVTFKVNDDAACGDYAVSVTVGKLIQADRATVEHTVDAGNVSVVCEHVWGEWEVTTPATCKEAGVETRTCSLCGETETREIAKTEHNWGEWEVTTPATCKEAGVETRTCSICGDTETREIAKTEHTWGEWEVTTPATCTEAGVETRTCSVCGETETRELAATGHIDADGDGFCDCCGMAMSSPGTGDSIYVAVAAAIISMMSVVALTKKREF